LFLQTWFQSGEKGENGNPYYEVVGEGYIGSARLMRDACMDVNAKGKIRAGVVAREYEAKS
jgi:hypothetical protein